MKLAEDNRKLVERLYLWIYAAFKSTRDVKCELLRVVIIKDLSNID